MKKMHRVGIFLFTRDLRLNDNTTLLTALKECQLVIPIFIFNPIQISKKNVYKSNNCVQFMCECLDDLDGQLKLKNSKLFIFHDDPIKIIDSIIKDDDTIDCIYMNKDYTPFAIKRENDINTICKSYEIKFKCYEDYLLTGVDAVTNTSNKSYVKFTPFLERAKKLKVKLPQKNTFNNYVSDKHKFNNEYKENYHRFYKKNDNIIVKGGRTNALKILKNITNFSKYDNERDHPGIETTHLSAYLKFNVVSIREVYNVFKKYVSKTKLVTQLYWRDFYMIIMYHHPHVLGHNMNQKYNIKWKNNISLFKLWKSGTTGIPIIDAAMNQLNTTGWMHNRCRMIVANFLIKIMHIDWRYGEKYFATQLVDYDPSNNNGGWQWCGSTGTDSQPYFRYFNPWSQSEKYDYNCEYLKKWIPALKNVQNKDIHKWYDAYKYPEYKNIKYNKPIYNNSDISEQIKITLKMYSGK
jgi:deoxyribodipyrimidine photo-lyase